MTDFSTRPRRRPPNFDVVLAAAAAVVFLLAGAGAVRAWTARGAAEQARAETEELVDRLRQRVKTLGDERGSSGDDALASLIVLNAQAPPPSVLVAIEEALPSDVRLEGVTVRYEREPEIEMRVVARRVAAYDEFLSRLGRSPRLFDIAPGAESREDSLRATVRVRFRGEAP